MSNQELTNIKCDLAISYVRTVAARCNCAFFEKTRSQDGIGIDCDISKYHIGNRPNHSDPGGLINLQVKGMSISSKTMFQESDDIFEYNLGELAPISFLFYTVVVVLPEEEKLEEWIQIDTETLLMKCRAYYVKMDKKHNGGFISIPKKQMFTTDTLPSLFVNSVNDILKDDEIK